MSPALKNIERGMKAQAIRLLGKLMAPPDVGGDSAPPRPPDWAARPHRVLYLRYDRIGDMVLATGIIRAIARAQPTVTIDVLASPANARVLAGNPHIGRVLTFDRKRRSSYLAALLAMRRGHYDAVIDAMVMAPSLTTMLLMWASGARHRIGVGDRGNAYALTQPVPRLEGASHYIDHSAALLAAFGVDPVAVHEARSRSSRLPAVAPGPTTESAGVPSGGWDIWHPEIFLTDAERAQAETLWKRGPRFVVNVSAGAPHRYWPEERFIEVIRRIRQRFPNTQTFVIGAPEDAERMERIAGAAGASAAHTPDYRQMMALVASADIVLTADTSVTHIASAFDTPAVVMCARGLAPLYGPYGTRGRTVSTPGRSLETLDVEPVVAALEAVLATARGDRTDQRP
jgi:ADP-heptose:LPS heptosyltransferase